MLLDVYGVFGFNSLYTFCDDIKCYIFIKYDFKVCIERDQLNSSKWYSDISELLHDKKNKYDNSYAERVTFLWDKYIVK